VTRAVIACLLWTAAVGEAANARWLVVQEPSGKQSVRDGVYSEPQASRGLREYTRSCERCHGSDLTGNAVDEVPALVADTFMFHFGGRTVQALYDRIRKGMPADAPGTLDPAAYLDVVAYLLEANGFPRGPRELDRSRLGDIVIEKGSSGAAARNP
jgi:mono/diheme cytochrome c family protein